MLTFLKQQMNKIKGLYPTELSEQQDNPHKDTYNRFTRRLEDTIKHTVALKKIEYINQSKQMQQQLNQIKQRSNKYKKKIYEQQKQFEEKVENTIKYDINKYEEYQEFFKGHFQSLEHNIESLKKLNLKYKKRIEQKTQELKAAHRQNIIVEMLSDRSNTSVGKKNTREQSTKQSQKSSVKLAYSISSKKVKTETSLPQLKPSTRYERIKTIQTEYDESPRTLKTKARSQSYMQPIGAVRGKQQSQLSLLGELLTWYKKQEDPNNNWFLKIVYNARHYKKLQNYIQVHSGQRRVNYRK